MADGVNWDLLRRHDWTPGRIWTLAWRLRLIPARTASSSMLTGEDVSAALLALLEHVDRTHEGSS